MQENKLRLNCCGWALSSSWTISPKHDICSSFSFCYSHKYFFIVDHTEGFFYSMTSVSQKGNSTASKWVIVLTSYESKLADGEFNRALTPLQLLKLHDGWFVDPCSTCLANETLTKLRNRQVTSWWRVIRARASRFICMVHRTIKQDIWKLPFSVLEFSFRHLIFLSVFPHCQRLTKLASEKCKHQIYYIHIFVVHFEN